MATTQDKAPPVKRAQFLQSPEGGMFAVGCCMLILWFETVATLFQLNDTLWPHMVEMKLTHLAFGRAAAIAVGTKADLPRLLIALLATYTDVMAMLIMFPLLVFSYRNLFERPFFQRHMKPVFDTAQRNLTKMRRFKVVGVFLFVWFPFWMTGIITGAVLGYLLGLRTWVNVTTVILGAFTAVVCWVYAYDRLFGWLGTVDQRYPPVIVCCTIAALIGLRLVKRRRELSEQKTVEKPDER